MNMICDCKHCDATRRGVPVRDERAEFDEGTARGFGVFVFFASWVVQAPFVAPIFTVVHPLAGMAVLCAVGAVCGFVGYHFFRKQ